MNVEQDSGIVKSRENSIVKLARALHSRKARQESGMALLEGVRLVSDALASGLCPEVVLYEAVLLKRPSASKLLSDVLRRHIRLLELSPEVFKSVSDTETSQGVLAIVKSKKPDLMASLCVASQNNGLVLALEGIQDPGNVGTMIRAAAAANAMVLAGPGTADPWSPKCLRASMGSIFRTPVISVPDWEQALNVVRGQMQLLVADVSPSALEPCQADLTKATCFIMANEGAGPSECSRTLAHEAVMIPMPGGTESLNVAMAASILLYEATRQRRA